MEWPSSETTFTRTFLEIFSGDSNSEQIFRFYVSHQQRWNELRLAIESPGTRAFNSAKLQPPMSLLPSFLKLPSYQKASSTLTHKIILGSKRKVTEPRKLKPLLHFSWTISCKKNWRRLKKLHFCCEVQKFLQKNNWVDVQPLYSKLWHQFYERLTSLC